jgi:steroid delta-isomerase-like uncharacterized protein
VPVARNQDKALEVVRAHMAAEDRQDVEATLATFTDDCYYRVPGLGIELRGKDQIRAFYADTFAAIPDFRNADEHYYVADGTVFFEGLMEGTHLGTWAGWAATGRRFSAPLLVRIPIAPDGRLEAEIVYFDAAGVFMALGVLPPRQSTAERVMQEAHRLRMRLAARRRS